MKRHQQGIFAALLIMSTVCCGKLRLRETSIPHYRLRGDTAELRCDYDRGNSSIYSVRWFKDDEEFYRYVPRDRPSYQVFPRPDIDVDEAVTRADRVVLRRVGFNASGQYRCEVSAEAPDFNTVTGRGSMLVIEPPTSGPVITGGRDRYRINDTVDLLCTSSPSRPPTTLSWRLNGNQPSDDEVRNERPYIGQDGLLTQISRLMFVAAPENFRHGKLSVKCIAEIAQHHLPRHVVPDTFRPWGSSFQASPGTAASPSPIAALAAVLLMACGR